MSKVSRFISRFYVLAGVGLAALQIQLLVSTPIAVLGELYFFPWLVKKGLLPFRDFFDHHGILLYYILAPLLDGETFTGLYIYYLLIQTANLVVMLVILHRLNSKMLFIAGGLIFVLANFFISDNLFWYDHTILLVQLLVVYVLLNSDIKHRVVLVSILAAVLTLLKPTAAALFVPIFLFTRSAKIIIPTVTSWIVLFGVYFYLNGLPQLIKNLFLFNRYIFKQYALHNMIEEQHLWFALVVILIVGVVYFFSKRIRELSIVASFIAISVVFLPPHYPKIHLLHLVTFSIIFFCMFIKFHGWQHKRLFFALYMLLALPAVFLAEKRTGTLNKDGQVVLEHQTAKNVVSWINKYHKGKPYYMFGDKLHIYYLTDTLPPTYYAVLLPFVETFYPNYQQETIAGLEKEGIETVIVPFDLRHASLGPGVENQTRIKEYILQRYTLTYDKDGFQVYTILR